MSRRVLSFDAGITHVGVVYAEVSDDWTRVEILNAACVDITDVRHERVAKKDCKIPHTNSLAHRYAHFMQELGPVARTASHFFVEQQPPQSAGLAFEQLLLLDFQGCTTSVSPARIHQRFSLPRGDYDRRKEASCACAVKLYPALAPLMRAARRAHDIADAACILHYQCEQLHVLWRQRRVTKLANMERFAFRPTCCRACAPLRAATPRQMAYSAADCPRCSGAKPAPSRGLAGAKPGPSRRQAGA